MDREASKRKHHGQPHEFKVHGKTDPYQLPDTSDRQISANPKRRPSREKLPPAIRPLPELSGDDDYVRRWLTQTDREQNQEPQRPPTRGKDRVSEVLETRHIPKVDFRSFGQATREEENERPRRKRRHRSTSDSSLLELITKPEPKSRKEELPSRSQPERREEPVLKERKKRKTASSDSASVGEAPRRETFEKRDRHKTREDRYEPKEKKHKSDKAGGEKRPRKKREKKGDKRRELRKSSENLRHNFSSKNIGQERVTMRPSLGPGLFGKGRASSPVQRRGLPDLVFSEMDFLQRPSRQPAPAEAHRATSKSREKDKRRATRKSDEISMFFKPTKKPLSEISPKVRKERSSTYLSDERSSYLKQEAIGQARERSISAEIPEKIYEGFGAPAPSSKRLSISQGQTSSTRYHHGIPNTNSKSETTTTGVTWSETQMSPGAMTEITRQVHEHRRPASSTPEPIRKSIESTGVLRGVGMGRTSSLRSLLANQQPPVQGFSPEMASHGVQTFLDVTDRKAQKARREENLKTKPSENVTPASLCKNRHQKSRLAEVPKHKILEAPKEPTINIGEAPSLGGEPSAIIQLTRTVVEHYDPQLGWYQPRPSSAEKTAPGQANLIPSIGESRSTPMTREDIAKHARVKRPSTTLPVTRMPETRKSPNGNDKSLGSNDLAERTSLRQASPVKSLLAEGLLPLVRDLNSLTRHSAASPQGLDDPHMTRSRIGIPPNHSTESNVPALELDFDQSPRVRLLSRSEAAKEGGLEPTFRFSRPEPMLSESSRAKLTTVADLPARVLPRNSLRQPYHAQVSLEHGPNPLYFNQIRQRIPRQPDLKQNSEFIDSGQFVEGLCPEVVPYMPDVERDVLEIEQSENGKYSKDMMNEEHSHYELLEIENEEPQQWQAMTHEDNRQEQYETWDQPRDGLDHQFGVFDDQTALQNYILEPVDANEYQMVGEGISMQGFWRSRRAW